MLSRRIDSVQNQWCWTSVDELMLSPCRDNDQVSSLDILVLACDCCLASTGGEGQSLVNRVFLVPDQWPTSVRMMAGLYLVTNFSIDWHCHQYQLRIQPSPKDSAEVTRLRGKGCGHLREEGHFMFRGVQGRSLKRHCCRKSSRMIRCR